MAQYLGIPLLGPIAGVLVDRWDKRLTMLACDFIRLVAVAAIPLAYWSGALSTPLLFVCVAADQRRDDLLQRRLPRRRPRHRAEDRTSSAPTRAWRARGSVAEVAGPSIAAGLYSALGVAALLVDAASYLVSAACFRYMRPWGARTVARGIGVVPADRRDSG